VVENNLPRSSRAGYGAAGGHECRRATRREGKVFKAMRALAADEWCVASTPVTRREPGVAADSDVRPTAHLSCSSTRGAGGVPGMRPVRAWPARSPRCCPAEARPSGSSATRRGRWWANYLRFRLEPNPASPLPHAVSGRGRSSSAQREFSLLDAPPGQEAPYDRCWATPWPATTRFHHARYCRGAWPWSIVVVRHHHPVLPYRWVAGARKRRTTRRGRRG